MHRINWKCTKNILSFPVLLKCARIQLLSIEISYDIQLDEEQCLLMYLSPYIFLLHGKNLTNIYQIDIKLGGMICDMI